MPAVALWFYLGLIPKYLPPAATHSQHVPPAYTTTIAPTWTQPAETLICVDKSSNNHKLKVTVCWRKK